MSGLAALLNRPREEFQTPPRSTPEQPEPEQSRSQERASSQETQAPQQQTTAASTESVIGVKRAANIDPYIERVAQRTKLNDLSKKGLIQFSKMSYKERKAYKMAKILQIHQVVDAIQPASSKIVITKDQKTYMQKLAIEMLLYPSLSAYRDTVNKISLGILARHPTLSGYTTEIRVNPTKAKAFDSAMGLELTTCRNIIKTAMLKSMGKVVLAEDGTKSHVETMNIVDFVTEISDRLHDSHNFPLVNDMQITLQMCVRVSFLRQVLLDDPGANYWMTVDKKLADVRNQYPEATECSNFMLGVLHEDYKTFGIALANDLGDVVPSQSQREADLFAQNRENELPDPCDDDA